MFCSALPCVISTLYTKCFLSQVLWGNFHLFRDIHTYIYLLDLPHISPMFIFSSVKWRKVKVVPQGSLWLWMWANHYLALFFWETGWGAVVQIRWPVRISWSKSNKPLIEKKSIASALVFNSPCSTISRLLGHTHAKRLTQDVSFFQFAQKEPEVQSSYCTPVCLTYGPILYYSNHALDGMTTVGYERTK